MRLPLSLLIVAAFTQVGATNCGSIINDPGFELWCGEELCSWKLVRGEVRQATTWHKEDTGVELIGNDAAIAQLTPVNSYDGSCILFELVAKVDNNVDARLELDIFGDGTIDHSERMPTSNWQPLSYKLRIKGRYDGIRFVLSKRGQGRAVFAQIEAEITSGCEGLPEIAPLPAPLGAKCTEATQCVSGLCEWVNEPDGWVGSKHCVGCTASTCTAGNVCGLGEALAPTLAVPVLCTAAGSSALGEQCLGNAECESNMCRGGVCSACIPGSCASTEMCLAAYPLGPSVCDPGLGHRAASEPCATNADCASNVCNGPVRKQCDDGRRCDDPGDCPVEDGLEAGACTAVGVQGGRCQ
ncbi:MAG: hypothetical protein H0T42_01185 [Deltaproteobacteria bacterium]|nr:hypothetical protein [Deltaproteobacteria bacterium]